MAADRIDSRGRCIEEIVADPEEEIAPDPLPRKREIGSNKNNYSPETQHSQGKNERN